MNIRQLVVSFTLVISLLLTSKFVFSTGITEVCVEIIRNSRKITSSWKYPARILKWDHRSQNFALFEAFQKNGTLLCSVNFKTDIAGKYVRVSISEMHPYVMQINNYTGVIGYMGEIWNTLEETLKFTSVFKKASSSPGDEIINLDIFLGSLVIRTLPAAHFTYSFPLATSSYSLFTMPDGMHVSEWWYIRIFSPKVWKIIFSFFILVSALVFIGHCVQKTLCYDNIEDKEFSTISFILLCVLGGITGQGIQLVPGSWSLRFLFITSLLMGVFLACGFSSTLTSLLAIRGNNLPLKSLEDIAEKRTHSLCLRKYTAAYIRLTKRNQLYEPLQEKWRNLVNTPNCPEMESLNNLTFSHQLCRRKVAYLETPDVFISAYRHVQHDCRIVTFADGLWSQKMAFLYARAFPYRKYLDSYLLRLKSSGILGYLARKWLSKELPHDSENIYRFYPVEREHMQIIILFLGIMICLSAFICVLENIWFNLDSSSNTKQNRKTLKKQYFQKINSHYPFLH